MRPRAAAGAWLLVALVSLAGANAGAQERQVIRLVVGESYAIPAASVSSYSMSGPDDLEWDPTTSSLVVHATRPGTFTVLLIYANGAQRTIELDVRAGP